MTTSTPKETVKEMEDRLRKEINGEKPESIGSGAGSNFDTSGVKTKKTGGMEGMKLYIIIAVVSLIISFLVTNLVGVSPLNIKIKAVDDKVTKDQNDIAQTITSLGNMQTKLDAAIAGIPSNVSSAIGTQVSTLQTQFGQLQAQVSGFSTSSNSALQKVNDLASQISTLTQNITALQTTVGKVNTTQLSTDLTAVQTAVTALQTQLAVDEANIQKLQASLPSNSTTGTSGLTSTLNGVTVTLTGTSNWLTGTSGTSGNGSMSLTTSQPSGTFGITINNTTGAVVSNFQLGLGFVVYDYNNTTGVTTPLAVIPAGSTMTDNTFTNIWTITTDTGYTYVFGFQNGVTGNNFLGIGGWSLPVGTSSYTMTFTLVIPGGLQSGHTYYVNPFKVSVLQL